MKKALALLLAMSLVFSVFAEDVAFDLVEFDGSASLDWKFDLDDEAFGLVNSTSTKIQMNFFSEVEKATTGDGMWGELVIKSAKQEVTVEDGDPDGSFALKAAAVDTAKLHILNGDFGLVIDILNHDLGLFNPTIPTATRRNDDGGKALGSLDVSGAAYDAGFTANITSSIVDFDVVLAENGVKKADEKKFATAAGVSVKPIDGLAVKAGFAYDQIGDTTAFAVGGTYEKALNDKMYVSTGAKFGVSGDEKMLGVGAMLGWGGKDLEPGFYYVGDKTADGVSVNVSTADLENFNIELGAYDSTLVAGLELGAEFDLVADTNAVLKLDAKYGTAIDIWNFSTAVGIKDDFKVDNSFEAQFQAGIETSALIQNTDVYLKYEGFKFVNDSVDTKGAIIVGTKIHF